MNTKNYEGKKETTEMTTEEMFTQLREEQSKTRHAHHVTTNKIYTVVKVSLAVAAITSAVWGGIVYAIWQNIESAKVQKALNKGLFLGERIGKSRGRDGNFHTDEDLIWKIDNIVRNPVFSWEKAFKAPGIQCNTIGELADSGANRFTELLKERRDGPIALTLNK